MKGESKKKGGSKDGDGINRSTLGQHTRDGKVLKPPLSRLDRITTASWVNERLPEMVWGLLLIHRLGRTRTLEIFRRVADYVRKANEADSTLELHDASLSALAATNKEQIIDGFIQTVLSDADAKAALRPLLLFKDLPARERWSAHLDQPFILEDWPLLAEAVLLGLDHQSQESTDCRWVRVLTRMLAGKIKYPRSMEKKVEELFYYPDRGDMREVRPHIRASEIMFSELDKTTGWHGSFWNQCFRDTNCVSPEEKITSPPVMDRDTAMAKLEIMKEGVLHTQASVIETSESDAKHDCIFGIALYAIELANEVIGHDLRTAIGSRFYLRTLTECLVNLAYLTDKDDPELWEKFRNFGTGQAKLASLKVEGAESSPAFVDEQTLKSVANEEQWEEFTDINLGHWAGSDLRTLSMEAGMKELYDRYYPWSSTFAHGHWGALRETLFDKCLNPLHRLHKIPRPHIGELPDATNDVLGLVQQILDVAARSFPISQQEKEAA